MAACIVCSRGSKGRVKRTEAEGTDAGEVVKVIMGPTKHYRKWGACEVWSSEIL